MAAELKVVASAQPGAVSAESIAAALERFRTAQATPLAHYDPELGAVWTFRKLTAAEMRQCRNKAMVGLGTPQQRVDQDKLAFYVVNLASIEPKVTQTMWDALEELPAVVQATLINAHYVANGMVDKPVEAAKNASGETQN